METVAALPHGLLAAAGFAIVLGMPLGLYWLLTLGQRRKTREIRLEARRRGWRYRVRRWRGDPTAFRMEGHTRGGAEWVITSGAAGETDRGWAVQTEIRFPELAGEVDLAIYPRGEDGGGLQDVLPSGAENKLARVSATAASIVAFFGNAREVPTGVFEFDARYMVMTLRDDGLAIHPALAERILRWPQGTAAPHSIVAWRDPFGLHVRACLPGPPNWTAVLYFQGMAEDFSACVAAGKTPAVTPKLLDRIAGGFLDS